MRYVPIKTALTPEQKESKKDWLLQQQRAGAEVPSKWDVYLHHHPEHADKLSDAGIISYNLWKLTEKYFDETEESLVGEDPYFMGLDPDGPESDAYYDKYRAVAKEYIEKLLAKISSEDLDSYREEWVRKQRFLSDSTGDPRILDWYDEAVELLGTLPGKTCYRAVLLPRSVDPVEHAGLGIYWSYDEWGAKAYWSGDKHANEDYRIVIYEARIDAENIDVAGTLQALTTSAFRVNNEREVRFYRHAPIFVYGVRVYADTNRYDDPSEYVKINDWRRT